jgi:O-antigen ligase
MGAAVSVDQGAWERISDFSESSGRTELWTVAWQVWADHPFVGVGFQGFLDSASAYARELGPLEFSEFLAEQPKVVHNGYLELLAETGIIGLSLFLTVVIACIRQAWRATQLFESRGDLHMATVSRSVVAAIVAMLTAAFFISGSVDRRLWVILALGPALAACAAARETRLEPVGPVRRAGVSPTDGRRPRARPLG